MLKKIFFFIFRIFHKTHVYRLEGHPKNVPLGRCKCRYCGATIDETSKGLVKSNWIIFWTLALAVSTSHADKFLGGKQDSVFFYDTPYTISVVLEESKCDSVLPCILNFTDGVNLGGYLFGLKGFGPGDTLRASYTFDSRLLPGPTARIAFTGPLGTLRAWWNIRLEKALPVNSGITKVKRKALRRPVGLGWRVNGRVMP